MDQHRDGLAWPRAGRRIHMARRHDPVDLGAARHVAGATAIRGTGMKKEYDFSKARRGPVVRVSKGKTRITIRLDDDVLAWFREQVHRAGGGSYQALINDALRRHIEQAGQPLEATLRRVIREELRRAS